MITQQTIDQVTEVLVGEFDPVEIYLFGSYAWGHPTEDSDLDILVVVDDAVQILDFVKERIEEEQSK